MVQVHEDEAVTSIHSFPELHENETTPSVTEPLEFEETAIASPQPSLPVTLETAESAISDEVTIDVQDSEPSTPVPANLPIHVQGKLFGFIFKIRTKFSENKTSVYLQMILELINISFLSEKNGFNSYIFLLLFSFRFGF